MKLTTTFFLLLVLLAPLNAQRYITKTGHISFYSHTPLEDIKADNDQVASVIDLSTGEMVFQALIKSFNFERALMQEHFNENYMESDKYPRATFKGKITDPAIATFKNDGRYDVRVEGELNIHNVAKQLTTTGVIEKNGNNLSATSKFIISPEDYNIEIPAVVRDNIAKTIEVTVDMKYTIAENK